MIIVRQVLASNATATDASGHTVNLTPVFGTMDPDSMTASGNNLVLTSSAAEQDIVQSYDLQANCYVCKPVDLDQFMKVVQSIEDFWLTVVKLPRE